VFYKVSLGLVRWLNRNITAFDVVHTHSLFSFAPIMAARIARRAGVPYVLRPLGVLAQYGMEQRRPKLKRMSFNLLERGLIESAAAVHFTSRLEQAQAEALGLKCRSVMIPLGVDIQTEAISPRWQANSERIELLFLSRIDPVKNLEGLLRAMAIVCRQDARVFLRIGGDGETDYVESLKSLAAELGIAERVAWLGYVSGERKKAELSNAKVFVQPSYSESFGIATIEALAAGLPTIVSDGVATHQEIVSANAGIVTGSDAESIAHGILRFLAQPEIWNAMSQAARRLAVEQFSLDAMGEGLESLYHDIARERALAA
jgi:glycosyltransferase involved in cell wall biosynthesis